MPEVLKESLVILALILLNGFFAATEIAIISLRKSKTRELINKGFKRAQYIAELQEHPERFLATIQVGITIITTLTSAYGGARLVDDIAPLIAQIPLDIISQNSGPIAFIVIVLLISYFSLILGELVPKSLALAFTDKIALFASYPIKLFSKFTYIIVKFLTFSTNVILAPFKKNIEESDTRYSEEEIRHLLAESKKSGEIEQREHEMIENVFEFGDLEVGKIMIPQSRIHAFEISDPPGDISAALIESGYTRVPIYEEHLDNVLGILYSKDLFERQLRGKKVDLKTLLRPTIFVPTTQSLHDILHRFKREKMHMAVVVDEHGGVVGLVTLEDILEEIVGDIADETDVLNKEILSQPDGSFVVDGTTLITDFNKKLDTEIPEDGRTTSISGFLLELLKRFPSKGEIITYKNLQFKVREKTQKRIIKVIVKKKR